MPVPLARDIAENIGKRTDGWLLKVLIACANELERRGEAKS